MRAGRLLLLTVALGVALPAWGQAPETSPRPRARVVAQADPASGATPASETAGAPAATGAPAPAMTPVPAGGVAAAVALAMTAPPPRPEGAMTIAEAARQEAERQSAAASAAAAPALTAIAEAQADGSVSPLAVPESAVPPRRSAAVVERYAALQRERAQGRTAAPVAAAPEAQPQQAAATPRRAGGSSGSGLCGVPGLAGRQIARITSSTRGCGVDEPVSVTSVQGIPLSMAATIDCPTAVALDRWIRQEALPALGDSGGGVVQIRIAAHYICRPRNNQSGARISEHGRGRAVDIGGFRLANGQTVTVLEHYRRGPFSRAMQAMYRGACGIFGTTLGPESDRFHQDHFHFDTARHRNGSYCR